MYKSVLKYYNTSELSSGKVIDSNARMEQRLKELKSVVPVIADTSEEDSDATEESEFSEGLGAEAIDALTSDRGDIIKAKPPEDPDELLRRAQEKADEIVATAEQLGNEFKTNSRREAEIEAGRIRMNARQEGYDDGIRQAEEEFAARMEGLDQREAELERTFDEAFLKLEPQFVQTITTIYEHIFHTDLSEYGKIIDSLVSRTMRETEKSRNYLIHVSPEDYSEFTEERIEKLRKAAGSADLQVSEDVTMGRGDCMLETDSGVFDCGLDTELSELRKKLMLLSFDPGSESAG